MFALLIALSSTWNLESDRIGLALLGIEIEIDWDDATLR